MPAVSNLVVRDDSLSANTNLTPTMLKLLIALLVLFVITASLVAALLILRSLRRSRHCLSDEKHPSNNYKRLTIDTTKSTAAYVIQEKRNLIENSSSPPPSPLPEIRITFPDEVDKSGRPHSGRVVVVRMGENSAVGLEPLEDQLPPYEKNEAGKFQSLDLDRMGGLKEKELDKRYC